MYSKFPVFISHFQPMRPPHANTQAYGLDWLVEAHTRAEASVQKGQTGFDAERFRQQIRRYITHFGCKPDRIGSRGSALEDFCHLDWDRMRIYRLHESPEGAGMDERTRFYGEAVGRLFEALYPEGSAAPEDLIHVTCTGYVAPSGAQRLIERRGWHRTTTVTHAYHMGCYAAVPSLRMAAGFLAASHMSNGAGGSKRRADIVHTELCTLHLNPAQHTAEQLVVQSLFADGCIRYSALTEDEFAARPAPGFELLAAHEEVVPASHEAMTWQCVNWGMQIGLSRGVPGLIADALAGFMEALFARAGLSYAEAGGSAVVAVHPGGPKIIEKVQECLGLSPAQVAESKQVLFDYGNMSSATLPHVWDRIARSPAYPAGTCVASVAFGPGLSICGSLLRKV